MSRKPSSRRVHNTSPYFETNWNQTIFTILIAMLLWALVLAVIVMSGLGRSL